MDPAASDGAAARLAAMDPFPDLSEDEIVQLLEAYEKSGMGLGPVPEDLAVSWCVAAGWVAVGYSWCSAGERRF